MKNDKILLNIPPKLKISLKKVAMMERRSVTSLLLYIIDEKIKKSLNQDGN